LGNKSTEYKPIPKRQKMNMYNFKAKQPGKLNYGKQYENADCMPPAFKIF
jgi:hypothetical protein